jgi:hypothetical protein
MVRLKLSYQIPEFLPMWGKKARVYYHGIPPFCVSCYGLGHVKNSCDSETISWRDYIHRLVDSGISKELFGSWLSCNLSVVESSKHAQPSFSKRSKSSSTLNKSTDESITPHQLLEFFKKFQASTPNTTPLSLKSNSSSKASSSRSKPNSNSKIKDSSEKKSDSTNQNRNRGRGRGRGRGQKANTSDPEPKNKRGRGRG